MKRIILLLLALVLLAGCVDSPAPPESTADTTFITTTVPQPAAAPPEIRALWLSYFDLSLPPGGISEQAYREKYGALFDEIAAFGINTLFVHVRPFSDAIYPSEIYPWSEILTGTQGKNPGYDPLGILCELAGEHGLQIHAWLNPFRIMPDHRDLSRLAGDNPALPHIEVKDGWVQQTDGRHYWNPAVPETHALVYDGVRELLAKYPLAGIHIDDYFYPTQDARFDAAQYGAYQAQGGALSLAEWRRELISQFVSGLYRTVHAAQPEAVLSVSPTADIEKNHDAYYADAARWMREPGFADWMIPQVYYGFEHAKLPFEATAHAWAQLPRHAELRLLCGLAAYKAGKDDQYAGADARGEWQAHSGVLARQFAFTRAEANYSGAAFYSCEGLFGSGLSEIAQTERSNLHKLLIIGQNN